MRQRSVWAWSASAAVLIPILTLASVGPTRVRPDTTGVSSSVWSSAPGGSTPVRLSAAAYNPNPSNSAATPEIIGRVGGILGAIDNPEKRNQLAEQWLQYSKQVIAREQEFRDQWLQVQREQLAQQDQAAQLQREIAQLQMRLEELRAQNLRLEQENLQARRQLSERSPGPAPGAFVPARPSP